MEATSELGISIRSVRPGPFIRRQLDSIRAQRVLLAEICIVVPDDLEASEVSAWTTLVEESSLPIRLVSAKRGMITQRAAGVQASRARLTLLLDDDIVMPDGFIQVLSTALETHGAQCVVPYVPEAWPRAGLMRAFFATFLMAVPYRGNGGSHYLPSGGYLYASEPLPFGVAVETEGGIGWAFLVDTAFARAHPQGSELQQPDSVYSTREDASFLRTLGLAGARILMVNAGRLEHLGGTTRLDPRRLFWQWESAIRDNFMFWRTYIYGAKTSRPARVLACAAIAWHLTGSMVLASIVSLSERSLAPMRGVASGFNKLLRGV